MHDSKHSSRAHAPEAARSEDVPALASRQNLHGSASGNRRVLLVDDREDVLNGLELLLRDRFAIRTTTRATEAIEILRTQGSFAAIVADFEMPDLSGVDLLALVRNLWPETSRILLTGHDDVEVAARAVREGEILRFLRKPIGAEELGEALETGVARYEGMRSERLLVDKLRFAREALLSFTEQLEERVRKQEHTLERLRDLVARLTAVGSCQEIADLAVETAHGVLGGRSVCLQLDAHLPGTGNDERPIRVSSGGSVGPQSYRQGVTIEGREIGCFQVGDGIAGPAPLAQSERETLSSIASSVAVAIHNQLRRRQRDNAHHATAFALARLAERRDDCTGKHLERVSAYCRLIAEGLRAEALYPHIVDSQYIDDIARSAPLHDIGKVGIPDSILLKPSTLNEEEWEVMRQHPTIGADTLRSIIRDGVHDSSFLEMGIDIAWAHHERWDGGGYPRALEGEEIPLAARILAIADCYDALTSRRPYKEPWSHQRAVAYVADRSGSQFDPSCVRVFLRQADLMDQVRESLADTAV